MKVKEYLSGPNSWSYLRQTRVCRFLCKGHFA
jgi:hypothetical protein